MFRIALLLLISSSYSFAGVEEIMGPPPVSGPKTQPRDKVGLDVAASFGLGGSSYNLSSESYSAFLPLSLSTNIDLQGRYRISRTPASLKVNYSNQQVTFSNINSISPHSVSVFVDTYDVEAGYDLSSQWSVFAGYRVKIRSSTQTTPQDVVSSVYSSGPIAEAQFTTTLNAENKLRAAITVYFPNFYDETSTSSGYSNSSMNFRFRGTWLKAIKEDFYLGVGLWLETDLSSFSGTGTRLTTNARESFFKAFVPLTIEMEF